MRYSRFESYVTRQEGKKSKKAQRKPQEAAQQKPVPQEQRSIEERFLVKSEAKAKGEDEPAVAFQKRLEALKRESRAKLKVNSSACLPRKPCLRSNAMHGH
jgi:hypothetical protein